MILVSIIYFLGLFLYIIPAVEDPQKPYWGFTYSALGSNLPEAIQFIIQHPVNAFKLLYENQLGNPVYDGIKQEFYLVTLYSGGILLFLRPQLLIMFIPLITQKMWNDSYIRWGINAFYSMEVVSILSICVFDVIIRSRLYWREIIIALVVTITAGIVTINKLNDRTAKWYIIEKENILSNEFYTNKLDNKSIQQGLNLIPEDAAVVASESLVAHLAYRSHIYCFPYIHDATYMILLNNVITYPLSKKEYDEMKYNYCNSTDWKVLLVNKEITVLRRKQ